MTEGAYGIKEVPPSTAGAMVCGTCGKAWAEDITPASRCPWEDQHIDNLYPEHARQALVLDKSQAIGEFLEWLTSEHEYVIAEWTTNAVGSDDLVPVQRPIQSWLAQYFQIDPAKIEAEKRAMLDAMRAQHESASA